MAEIAQLIKLYTIPMHSIQPLVPWQLPEVMNLDLSHPNQLSIWLLEQVLWQKDMPTILSSIWPFKKFQIHHLCSLVNLHSLLTSVCQVQADSQMLLLRTAKHHSTQETNNHKTKNLETFLENRYLTEHWVLLSEILIQDSLNKLYVNLKLTFYCLTHIGKLSGNDSGDFPETFSKIKDFKWNLKFCKFG